MFIRRALVYHKRFFSRFAEPVEIAEVRREFSAWRSIRGRESGALSAQSAVLPVCGPGKLEEDGERAAQDAAMQA